MARPREFDEDQALAGAMEVFWRRGFAGAGIQELCAAMELNPGSVYGAYGNKHALFIASLRRYLDDVTRAGMSRITDVPGGRDGIRAYFLFVVDDIVAGRRRWGCLGTNAFVELGDRDQTVRILMNEHYDRLYSAFQEALEQDSATSALSQTPATGARFLLCVAQGLNVLAGTEPSRESLMAIVDTALGQISGEGDH